MLRASRTVGLPVAWDLLHWGFPPHLDLMSPAFVDRAAAYATAAAHVHAAEFGTPPIWVPVNEISFWAWAGGVSGGWPPYNAVDADTLKAQLVRIAIAMSHAVRAVDPRAVLMTAEPLIAVHPNGFDDAARAAAATYEESQFTATDIVLGRSLPEFGGNEGLIDVIGCNYYPLNQFVLGGCCVPLGDFSHRAVRDLLVDLWRRYQRPVVITETGCEGDFRAAWFKYIFESAMAANAAGADIRGLCLYPVLDYPGWEDNRHCPCGAFDGVGDRAPYPPLLDEIARQQSTWPQASRVALQPVRQP